MKLARIMILSVFLVTGCNSVKTIYHWGDYSNTLYTYTKEPSTASRIEHKAELIELIGEAANKNKRVPPGIHFELAMLEAEDGNQKLMMAHFNNEVTLFPEAKKYVALALKELGAK